MMSNEQKDVVTAFEDGYNIFINSVAGSGKTTIALAISKFINRSKGNSRILYTCFNRSIKLEMDQRIKKVGIRNLEAETLHSIGLRAIRKNLKKRFNISSGKLSKISEVVITCPILGKKYPKLKVNEKWSYMHHVKNIFEFARLNVVQDFEFEAALVFYNESVSNIDQKRFDFNILIDFYNEFVKYYKEETFTKKEIEIDYTDMVFLPVFLNLNMNLYVDYLMMDEIQDFNLCQHKLMKIIIKDSNIKQFVGIGDSKQSIYGFTGSNPRLFDYLKDSNTVFKDMTLNFRCGYNIINKANEVYGNLNTTTTVAGIVNEEAVISDINKGSLVIARTINTLLAGYFTLLNNNLPAKVIGEDIPAYLKSILNKYKGRYLKDILEYLKEQIDIAKDPLMGDSYDLFIYGEDYSLINLLYQQVNFRNLDKKDIINKVANLLNNVVPEDHVTMCTIHKSKGLEADEVSILNIHEIPLKNARNPFQLEQEYNLKYVALTRAKKVLNLISL